MSVKADNTRENILNTAKKHFLRDGLDGASLRNIVKDAGLTTGAFYKYFPTKESLFDALIDPYVEHIHKIYDDVLAARMVDLTKVPVSVERIARRWQCHFKDHPVFHDCGCGENAAQWQNRAFRVHYKGSAYRHQNPRSQS